MTALAPDTHRATNHDGNGSGGAGSNGNGYQPEDDAPPPRAKRNSPWPLLMDLGWVTVLVSWLIFNNGPMVVVGALLAVVALVNWIREARKDFSNLAD
jgi:hypothetical protein